jgi:hypothetical protein
MIKFKIIIIINLITFDKIMKNIFIFKQHMNYLFFYIFNNFK